MNTTKTEEPVDVIDGATVQNLPSDVELALRPSYSDTLSKPQVACCSKLRTSNVTDTTCNIHRLNTVDNVHTVLLQYVAMSLGLE